MPETPRQADLIQVTNANGHVAEEGNQDRGAQNGTVALHAQQIDSGADAETRSRQSDSAERAQSNPQAPRHLVAQIGAGPESHQETQIRCINAGNKNDGYNDTPQG